MQRIEEPPRNINVKSLGPHESPPERRQAAVYPAREETGADRLRAAVTRPSDPVRQSERGNDLLPRRTERNTAQVNQRQDPQPLETPASLSQQESERRPTHRSRPSDAQQLRQILEMPETFPGSNPIEFGVLDRSRPVDIPQRTRTETNAEGLRHARDHSYSSRHRDEPLAFVGSFERRQAQTLAAEKLRSTLQGNGSSSQLAPQPSGTNAAAPAVFATTTAVPIMVARVPSSTPSVKEATSQSTSTQPGMPALAANPPAQTSTTAGAPASRDSPSNAFRAGVSVPGVKRVPVPVYNVGPPEDLARATRGHAPIVSEQPVEHPPVAVPHVHRQNEPPATIPPVHRQHDQPSVAARTPAGPMQTSSSSTQPTKMSTQPLAASMPPHNEQPSVAARVPAALMQFPSASMQPAKIPPQPSVSSMPPPNVSASGWARPVVAPVIPVVAPVSFANARDLSNMSVAPAKAPALHANVVMPPATASLPPAIASISSTDATIQSLDMQNNPMAALHRILDISTESSPRPSPGSSYAHKPSASSERIMQEATRPIDRAPGAPHPQHLQTSKAALDTPQPQVQPQVTSKDTSAAGPRPFAPGRSGMMAMGRNDDRAIPPPVMPPVISSASQAFAAPRLPNKLPVAEADSPPTFLVPMKINATPSSGPMTISASVPILSHERRPGSRMPDSRPIVAAQDWRNAEEGRPGISQRGKSLHQAINISLRC